MAIGVITLLARSLLAGLSLGSAAASAFDYQDDAGPPVADERSSASDYEATWTNFVVSAVAGDGSSALLYGAKLDGYASVDGRDFSLWDGLTINAHAEFVFGKDANDLDTGVILPVNTALAFPRDENADFDLALSVTQSIGRGSLTVGKINMIDRVSRTPLVGGGGREGFQHIAFAGPPSIFTPPSILGALLSFPLGRLSVGLGIWDAQSAVDRWGFGNLFKEGVAGMVALTLPITINGRRGFQSLTIMGDNKRGIDLEDIPDLFLPPESEAAVGERRGGWLIRYAFQQFIRQDPANPARGWGVFGKLSLWDGNPTPLRWSMNLGITGSSPIASRPSDRFGLAYFRVSASPALRDGLAPILALGPEQGGEAFYTFDAVQGRVRVTAAAQVIDPVLKSAKTAVLLGLRTLVRF